jgi:hypothetical protein
VNKEIDWHGCRVAYQVPRGWAEVHIGDRLAWSASGEGAWPKPIYPEPPCGWDERDALV